MELGTMIVEREPIVFDVNQLPDGFNDGREGRIQAAFCFDKVKFSDDLQTAVAKCNGIDNEGNLDMQLLSASERTAEYLKGRQGQPVVLINTVSNAETGQEFYSCGYIALLSDAEQLVGLHEDDRGSISGGIGVQAGKVWFNNYVLNDRLNTQYLHAETTGRVISLSTREFTLGFANHDDELNRVSTQEVIAGEDIIPWIIATYGEGDDGYHFYSNIINALSSLDTTAPEQLEHLLVGPFLSTMQAELDMLLTIRRELAIFSTESSRMQAELQKLNEDTNLKLAAVVLANQQFRSRIAVTSDSNPIPVTYRIDSVHGPKIQDRSNAIDYRMRPLAQAILAAQELR